MRKYIPFFLIFILIKTSSQTNKQQVLDDWALVKSRMLDGSRNLSERSDRFLIWKLSDHQLCEYPDPIFEDRKKCLDIKIENKSIRTSPKTFYEIDKLTNDTLSVIDRADGITSNDKIEKMWFVRISKLQNEYISTLKNDSIAVASSYFTPSLKKNIFFEIPEDYMYNSNLTGKGNIIIYPKKQKVDLQYENTPESKKNTKGMEFLKSTIEKSYHQWTITAFKNFDQVIIPYSFKHKTEYPQATMKFAFFKNERNDPGEIPVIIKDKTLSSETYNKGINALNDKKLDKAIELFNKAFDLDNTNVDALYNTVSISLDKKDMTTACIALKKLKEFEQTEGTQLFNQVCTKN
ncbi:lipopolysaccharide assembly protein LapB [Chryseobacterium sp. OSA05B]|uniref:tetratricopeptide repeat protein n=1 Tax=Chryseobacterium sp. OSA05B TaxID=2862650 RepID=UPI001CC11912|nr:tetratricopeptide repeat protein [Chryseobacterium sp. OSA05B]